MPNTFRSLANPNYRLWFSGAVISNIGGWLQRTAQDWLVISELSDNNAAAVGLVVFLQFAPQIFLLPITGWTADRVERRKLLFVTQSLMAILALVLGVLVLSAQVELWQVCLCALGLGCVAAFDAPARHAFVSDIVSEKELSNAVGLNAVSFNSARLVGPAVAGILIALVGSGWVFMINVVSFLPLLTALFLLKRRLPKVEAEQGPPGPDLAKFLDGFRYIWHHREMTVICIMSFLICCFGMNFPVYLSSMTVQVFEGQADQYGFLVSMMAIGSITGAIVTASRKSSPSFHFMIYVAGFYAVSCFAVALSSSFWLFAIMLITLGLGAQLFTTSTASYMQLATEKVYRGRVMAVVLAIAMGGTALGAPIVGFMADHYGARASILLCGVSGALAALLGFWFFHRQERAKGAG
ncbi:MFS transporter [Marinomonas posidonica]|uniref:Major facilitator superfamily MFS_1 n=1 Tax=Marinomonas posidonica (strain CECT 7376 / NCIMB 14433 / IVIA-Po-181) TaxID=491952 RepID=F6CX15_MARPP|nr:MFS transporter [Marinomonas posidonica]AEF53269.1 major facilitator superfamily MFS_1 [Marinomonas posidonica IVIA-Po-181]